MDTFLEMKHITKCFGQFYANEDVNLCVYKGEVHTLLGENGAGKSTLMNILMGFYEPTEGEIYIQGQKVTLSLPAIAVKYGIGMVHQHFMLVEAMTVFENIILGTNKDKGIFIHQDEARKEILALSDKYGLEVELDKEITEISLGEQQRVEILKNLYRGAELLILDEPTAVLTDYEVEGLFQIIKKLTSENKSVIFISHKMKEVLAISDRITVLRSGKAITTINKSEADANTLAKLMTGRKMEPSDYHKVLQTKEVVLELSHIGYHSEAKHNGLTDISLVVGKGEIVGIAGVDGNGQSELAQLVTGVIKPEEGEMKLRGKKIMHSSPETFIKAGVAHIPEDRNKMGLVGRMNVKENIALKLTSSKAFTMGKGLILKHKEITKFASQMQEKYDIRCASIEQEVRNLSGGNQQKIILAREIEQNPDLLVAVHPTRGLDIGATRYIHDQMIAARERGCGVLMISADLDEVLKVSDRIAVMFEGRIIGIFSGANPPLEVISLAMSGVQSERRMES